VRLTGLIENSHLSLIVEDDGRGFDPMHNRSNEAFGLSIMRERAVEIGAELHIDSAPEKGCRVMLTMPVAGGDNK
jgi:signal transduction histidine kinase